MKYIIVIIFISLIVCKDNSAEMDTERLEKSLVEQSLKFHNMDVFSKYERTALIEELSLKEQYSKNNSNLKKLI